MTTCWVIENTTLVMLECPFVSFDCNRNDLSLWSSSKLGLTSWHIVEALDIKNTCMWTGFTNSIFGCVPIITFKIHFVWFGIFESIIHETTWTSIVSIFFRAVYKLLLREALKSTLRLEVSTFHSSNSRESPAGTALFLVLNGGDSTLCPPVNSTSKVGFVENNNICLFFFGDETTDFLSEKFFVSHITELVDT